MMKKNWMVFPVVLLLMAGMAFVTVFSCGEDTPPGPSTVTYKGGDNEGHTYTLKITGNKYDLLIEFADPSKDPVSSTGKAQKSGDEWVLTPNADPDAQIIITVSKNPNRIVFIEGDITPDDGSEPITPGEIIEVTPIAGVWTWALSDDSIPNDYLDKQTIFAPGGASRFEEGRYIEDQEETDRGNNPVKRPYVYPAGEAKDNGGNPIDAEVFNFKGTTKVSAENRPATSGAQFPLLGWEAVPDEETLELLKTAYGYSFWVRLNSATESKWSFLTAIVTDYSEEKGWEEKHYFGNQPGDSGGTPAIKNFTSDLKLNEWYKITVVIDKSSSGFNIEQDKWMIQYYSTQPADVKAARDKPYDQSAAHKLQWQVPLQHQSVSAARSGEPYDIVKGSYTFDFDFYGLELIQ
ncbi:MAG: hypothetical protein LBH20_09950 [Treponema sp.]|nr:hypothetical protein [Treponema sp.]